jgi:hypothetical protein
VRQNGTEGDSRFEGDDEDDTWSSFQFNLKHQPITTTDNHDMALSSGIYTIENVKYHNWAMLVDGNDEGEVVSGSSLTQNVGEKVGP